VCNIISINLSIISEDYILFFAFFSLSTTVLSMSFSVSRHRPFLIKTGFGKSAGFSSVDYPSHSLYTLLWLYLFF